MKNKKLKKVSLHPHQTEVIEEAKKKKEETGYSGLCMSLPMGYGKTIMSLYLALLSYDLSLVICSKTLIASWVNEINKFYGDTLKFEVLHPDYIKKEIGQWKPHKNTRIVITTPEMVAKSYTDEVKEAFVKKVVKVWQYDNDYQFPHQPFTNNPFGLRYLHSVKWEGVFIDECQNYTSVTSSRCQAIASLCTGHRWLLSGTILQEVNIDRILGLFLLLNATYPRNITDCKKLVYNNYEFKGLNQYCIERKTNPNFKNVKLNSQITSFDLSKEESICYNMLKQMVTDLWKEYRKAMAVHPEFRDQDLVKKLGGSLLAMITYLRQALVIPQIPMCKLISRMADATEDLKIVSDTLDNTMKKYGLTEWIKSPNATVSTRVQNCINLLLNHSEDVIVVFGSYVVCLEFLKQKYEQLTDVPTFILSCSMNIKKRAKVLQDFGKVKKGVLFMTYMLGSEGLNLQHANTVIHLDLYWNKGKENQALARVFRSGQISPTVHQYIMVSNTGLEKAMLSKQKDKLTVLDQLKNGTVTLTKITGMPLATLVRILKQDDVKYVANQVNKFYL